MDLENSIKLSDPNSYYGTPFRYWITKYLPKMIQSICPKSNADILDLGCGQGQYAELIKSLPINGSYIGIDLDRRENWDRIESDQNLNIEFQEHNAENLTALNKSFNFILAVTTFEHFDDQIAVINGAFKVTDINGTIMIIIPSHYSYLIYGTHGYRRYSKKSLESLLSSAGYKISSSGKIGGLFSFIFHFLWRNLSFFTKRGLKLILYLCFFGKLNVARKKLPRFMFIIDNLMHLHLKTRMGRVIHKALVVNTHKLDHLAPIFEVGYYCIANKIEKNNY